MIIDIIFVVLLLIAFIKGMQKGLLIAVLSVVGLIIGLAAAMKLSAVVAGYLSSSVNIAARWLPFISFIIVFFLTVLAVRWLAAFLQRAMKMVMLGWANKVGGILLYALIYSIVYSILLFYLVQINVVTDKTIADSHTYFFIQPLGPFAIDGFGKLIPWFKDMFAQLQQFFERISHKIPPPESIK